MNKHLAKYLTSLLLFGTNGVVAAMTLMASSDIVVARIALGLAPLLLLLLVKLPLCQGAEHTSAKGALLTLASEAAMGTGWMCLFDAYSRIGVGLSTLLYYCGPVIVMALSPFLFKEKLKAKRLLCFVVVFIGSCLVVGMSYQGGADPAGLLLGVGAAVSYAALVILSKKATGIEGVKRASAQLAGALAAVVVLRLIAGDALFPIVPVEGAPWILLLGVVNTGLGCYLYFTPLPELSSQTVAVCGYLEPLSAILFAALLLGEALGPAQIIGGALIVGGAISFELLAAPSGSAAEEGS